MSERPLLVVHDDPDVREILVADLRAAGYPDVVAAADGEQGLEMACRLLPRLVVADIHMPGLDGFQLLRVLRQRGASSDIPVVLVSASYRDPAAARLAADLGASAYVDAPYRAETLRAAVAEALRARPGTAARARTGRILIVEDEPDIAAVIRLTLEARGFEVAWVADGPTALAAVRAWVPELLVLDYHMPGLTGLQVLQQLRADGIDVGAVVLSAHADLPLTVEFVRAGAEDVLQKPFEPGKLLAAVGRALERRALSLRASQFRERLLAAQSSEARCRSLVDMSLDVIWQLDTAGRVLQASPATALLSGRRSEALLGEDAATLLATGSRQAFRAALAAGAPGDEMELDLLATEGTTVPLSVRVQALRVRGAVAGFWVVGRDLRRQRGLAQRVALAEKRSGVARLVAGVSHEFSGLVSAILGTAHLAMLADDVAGQRDAMARIRQTAQRAAEIIEALRAVVWSERGADQVDLGTLAHAAAAAEAAAFAESGVRLAVDVAPGVTPVAGRYAALLRGIRELLSNARHACAEAGPGRAVRLLVAPAPEGRIDCVVEDEGVGIPPQDLASVFDPFFTTKGALGGRVHDGKVHGTGLGLAVTRAIAEAHDGELAIVPRTGGGMLATLRLPAVATRSHEPKAR